MKMAICGGTGFIGSALADYWLEKGHEITVVTRKIKPESYTAGTSNSPRLITWKELADSPEHLEGLDALVNLAGSSLNQRWTSAGKQRILESRLKSVQAVAELIRRLKSKPSVVIQGSAIGIYGTSLTAEYDENSRTSPTDFLSEVTTQWEQASQALQMGGVRVVNLRTGVVLGRSGGAFPLMSLPFRLGFGGRVGTGQQWMSWIHLMDIVRLIDFCVMNPDLHGPVNAVSPFPVTNETFGRTLARVYHRPYWFPLPAFLLKLALGEQSTLLLDGQRVIPLKAEEAGFTFKYPHLQQALEEIRSRI
ncbi:TIGR01777 family oxidoreductase [Paenibacillus tuaregi]|uniref:TIGR01777 family oxidoreductase n=1 Tax=Paenibacillus tuaregi TaxID=1816681 RepID=UPI00083800A1|nr:TIGR01777 family oxidoreductase [Paenibacillus tuaregi]